MIIRIYKFAETKPQLFYSSNNGIDFLEYFYLFG